MLLEPQLTVSGSYISGEQASPPDSFFIPIVCVKGHGLMFSYSAQDGPTFA